jgi:hypothetical protein
MPSTEVKEKERMTLFVPPDLSTDIRVIAAKERKTLSDIAVEAFQQYLTAHLN